MNARAALAKLTTSTMTPFWTMSAIRVGYWLVAIVALLWAPVQRNIPHFPADGPHLSLVFNVFAQWDSGWFIRIADRGYDVEQSASFFPLYPLLVRGVGTVLGSTVIAGVLVSLVAAGIAAIAVFKIAQRLVGDEVASDSVLFLALFPFAFVFTAVYSDALFLALASWSLLAGLRQQAIPAALLGGLAVATRPMGLALLPALVVLLWPRDRSVRSIMRPLALVLLPAALGAYALYLHYHFDDAGAFYHSQNVFWLRETPALGPLQGAWDALRTAEQGAAELVLHLPANNGYPAGFEDSQQRGTWNLLQGLLLVSAVGLTWVAWKRLGAAFGLYSMAVIAIVLTTPAAVVPLVSFPRFLIADFPLFIALASVATPRPRLRLGIVIGFAAVGGIAAIGFSRAIWIA
ncbi:MAG TPA: mannosyltransferase family protein [Gaiellaceae bacterium]|nr:mannosyltransferase family protein [Gaiellaceae bacterium]